MAHASVLSGRFWLPKIDKNGATDGPGGIGWASKPPSGILLENGRGESFDFGRPSGRLWDPGAPQSLRNPFWSDFFGSHFRPKVGKEASKKASKKTYRTNLEQYTKRLPKEYQNGKKNLRLVMLLGKRRKLKNYWFFQ